MNTGELIIGAIGVGILVAAVAFLAYAVHKCRALRDEIG